MDKLHNDTQEDLLYCCKLHICQDESFGWLDCQNMGMSQSKNVQWLSCCRVRNNLG